MTKKPVSKNDAAKLLKRKLIGTRLAQVRKLKKLSQKDIEALTGVPWRTYQNYEVGERGISADFTICFCEKFSVRPQWLIHGLGGMRKFNDLETVKSTIIQFETVAAVSGSGLAPEVKADIIVRLLRKQLDGYEISSNDIVDYVELANT